MRPVHPGLHLEHLPGERSRQRTLPARLVLAGGRCGGQAAHRLQQRPDPEVRQRRAEQHGGAGAGGEGLRVEDGADLVQQRQLLYGGLPRPALLTCRPLGRDVLRDRAPGSAGRPVEPGERARRAVDEAAEVARDADRPVQRGRAQADPLLDLVQQFEGLAAGTVPLVDEGDDGDAAVAAHVEQLQRLRLQALGRVQQHDRAVHGRQHPVGVLGEVRVAGGVEQVQQHAAVLEPQHRGGDGDAAGAFHVHPVGPHPAPPGLAVHRSGLVDRGGVQGERLGQRRLARVGVADHRERPPPRRLLRNVARCARVAAHRRPSPGSSGRSGRTGRSPPSRDLLPRRDLLRRQGGRLAAGRCPGPRRSARPPVRPANLTSR